MPALLAPTFLLGQFQPWSVLACTPEVSKIPAKWLAKTSLNSQLVPPSHSDSNTEKSDSWWSPKQLTAKRLCKHTVEQLRTAIASIQKFADAGKPH